jgi:hypothetical protein
MTLKTTLDNGEDLFFGYVTILSGSWTQRYDQRTYRSKECLAPDSIPNHNCWSLQTDTVSQETEANYISFKLSPDKIGGFSCRGKVRSSYLGKVESSS